MARTSHDGLRSRHNVQAHALICSLPEAPRFLVRMNTHRTLAWLVLCVLGVANASGQTRPPSELPSRPHRRTDSSEVPGAEGPQQLPGRAGKNLRHGVQELEAGRFTQAQNKLEAAYRVAPANPEVNFFLGYLYFQKNDVEHSAAYLAAAIKLDPHNLRAPALLGRLYLQNKNYDAARITLEHAVEVNPEDWTAHNLLAEVYLKQNQFEPAKEQAELALEKSHGAAYSARLPLAEAMMHLGQDQSALQVLQAYLREDSTSQLAVQARSMMAELEQRDAPPGTALSTAKDRGAALVEPDRVFNAPSPVPSLPESAVRPRP